ncbi:PHP domain-containing protein [Legionella jordanis]|nr:PHP domain-containing protein [Legionella jordanis]RMX03224.1 PHP domain-containing protein [Legionella jordanis]RMX18202.1 PHP domain-containing protein [Legionella jordanis]HAT8713140.1 PHP domain-containing protein [Legionella jordanis]
MIDLHCHSHFSDGKLSPEALLNKAIQSNVQILALTDHDTINGLESLHKAAIDSSVTIINGIELSARWKKHDVHVLGLNINHQDVDLDALIQQQNQNRINRALQIGEQMKFCGVEQAYSKACELAGHERVGRPHFAQVLVNEGVVKDFDSAFKRFLGRGRPAYVRTTWLTLAEAVSGIKKANGEAVLAHPLKYGLTKTKLHELITDFKEVGGNGLEVISGEMTALQINDMAGLCQRFQMLASTGSDYHGDALSRVSLGRQQQLPLNCTPIWRQWNI